MSRKVKSGLPLSADLSQVTPLSTTELEQVNGGYKVTLLLAMGWTFKDNHYLDKNGMSYSTRTWYPPK